MENSNQRDEMKEQEYRIYKRARRMTAVKIGFYYHLAVYITVNLLLLGINLAFAPEHYWVVFPAIFWGIAIVLHGVSVVLFGLGAREWMIRQAILKEQARLKAMSGK